MAADLQDPPELIPQFVARWEEGYDNVYGIVGARRGAKTLRRANSHAFYWIIGKLAEQPIPANARDFRLLDRRAYEQLQRMNEHNRFVRGLAAWSGFRSIGVPFDEPARFAGESKGSSRGLGEFAVRAIFANSLTPLRMMSEAGTLLVLGSGLALIALMIYWLVSGVPFPGFGTIIATMVLIFGVLASLLSILGVYVGLIYEEVRGRPSFVVRQIVSSAMTMSRKRSLPLAGIVNAKEVGLNSTEASLVGSGDVWDEHDGASLESSERDQ
jgi:dolichol-phosphate mannosyltransferase